MRQTAALASCNSLKFWSLGDADRAVEGALRQVELYRADGNDRAVQLALTNVALFECGRGRFDAAIELLTGVLNALQKIGAMNENGMVLHHLAMAHALRGDRDQALEHARAAVPHMQRTQDIATTLLHVALVHARHCAADRAARLLGCADRAFARRGRVLYPFMLGMRDDIVTRMLGMRDDIVTRARAALGPVKFERQMAAGAALTEEQALALAFDEGATARNE